MVSKKLAAPPSRFDEFKNRVLQIALKVKQFYKKVSDSSDYQHSEDGGHHYLPEDLVIEILLRLPVKTLLRFKSVCKNWNSIIKTPEFINDHYHHRDNHGSLLVRRFFHERKCFFEFCPDETLSVSPLYPHIQHADPLSDFLGPLNGVFLLFNSPNPPALWNPATRETKSLPPAPESVNSYAFEHLFGLGIDPLTNLLKIIWIIWKGDDEPTLALVYTLGDDSWRKLHLEGNWLNNSTFRVYPSLGNTYLDGVYYWNAQSEDPTSGEDYVAILSFNMEDEVFREIQGLPRQVPKHYYAQDIALYKDCLAMFAYPDKMETSIEIWVMESVGYWTKQLTIGPILYVGKVFLEIETTELTRALGFSNNGEVFLEIERGELMLCDPTRNQVLRKIGPGLVGIWPSVFNYKESLVSLMG